MKKGKAGLCWLLASPDYRGAVRTHAIEVIAISLVLEYPSFLKFFRKGIFRSGDHRTRIGEIASPQSQVPLLLLDSLGSQAPAQSGFPFFMMLRCRYDFWFALPGSSGPS